MLVLLVNPGVNQKEALGRYRQLMTPIFPINLGYIAAVLEREGVEVECFDEFALGGGTPAVLNRIRETRPDLVGFSTLTQTAPTVYGHVRAIRERFPDLPVVQGNLHAGYFADDILQENLADVVVIGEGEETMVELVRAIEEYRDLRDVKGLAYREGGEVVHTEPRPTIENLDDLPFPAWHKFPLEKYRLMPFVAIGNPSMIVLGTRGCPYKCTFCSLIVSGNRRRKRSVPNVVDEIQALYERYDIRSIAFVDPIFPITKKEGLAFSDEMMARGLHEKVTWVTETRVDRVDPELLRRMREAGCRRIMYGIESGSQEQLDAVRKNYEVPEARRAVEMSKEAGMETVGFFMIGLPGETWKSAMETIRLSQELDLDYAKFGIAIPYPGTPLYEDLKAAGKQFPLDWNKYTNFPSDPHSVLFVPEGLTGEQLIHLHRKAIRTFYLRPKMVWNHLVHLRTVSPLDLAYGFFGIIFTDMLLRLRSQRA